MMSPVGRPEWANCGRNQPWPFSSHLQLGALPGAAPCARLHTVSVLHEWGLRDLADDTALIVSELVTNAGRTSANLTHSRYEGRWRPGTPPVRLRLSADAEQVLIQVWDGDPQLPQLQDADLMAESGRGLLLVASLSTQWGAYPLDGSSGKVVWACAAGPARPGHG
jgi:anti-sigma regulatory factor (Ser/Thr protein kinase)